MLEVQLPSEIYTLTFRRKLLQAGFLVRFTNVAYWPDHVRGKTFKILQKQETAYVISCIIPGGDYIDINLSNQEAGEKLYPIADDRLTELVIGFKPGEYIIEPRYPANRAIYRLDYATMEPNIADEDLRWLGAWKPEDSPAEDPRIHLFLVKGENPIYLRAYVLASVDYDKVVIPLLCNRMGIEEIKAPSKEQLERARLLYALEQQKI